MSTYEYSGVNRLTTPHSYMYTPYEGRPFLVAYRQARRTSLERLLARANSLSQGCAPDERRRIEALRLSDRSWAPDDRLESPEGSTAGSRLHEPETVKEWIDTVQAMDAALVELSRASEARREAIRLRLNRYVARFEVTKKLAAGYDPGFTRACGREDDLELYAAFSLALLRYHARWSSVKFLNAALKVNDLLTSVPGERFSAYAANVGIAALRLEQEAIETLMAEKGIADGA